LIAAAALGNNSIARRTDSNESTATRSTKKGVNQVPLLRDLTTPILCHQNIGGCRISLRPRSAYALGEGDGEVDGFSSLFFLEDFLVVDEVVDFFVLGLVLDFLVVALSVLALEVVVVDSFLLAHEVIKPKAARTATDVIRDFFIRCS
jgi:hypothetical protein